MRGPARACAFTITNILTCKLCPFLLILLQLITCIISLKVRSMRYRSHVVSAYVAYHRVSTAKQGASGLGLEAQEAAINAFVRSSGANVVARYVDIESGAHDDRAQLSLAIEHAKAVGATVLVATLDRLSRDVHFISGLMKRGVDFKCADMPNASTFELHIRAAIGEEERRKISARTKAALAAARARGVKLGGYRGSALSDADRASAIKVRASEAKAKATAVLPMIEQAKASGATTLRAIAGVLNAKGIATPRGGTWSAVQVSRVLERAAA